MSLRNVNLNLLPVLRTLLKHAHISRAAEELCLTQPATSNALNRLRELLGDPLLVQVGRTMRLTPRAQALLPQLDDVCTAIDGLLHERTFKPTETERSFIVSTPDYMALLLGPALIAAFRDAAPKVSVRFVDVHRDFSEQLAAGSLDVAVLAWNEPLAPGLCVQRGYLDRMVGVVAQGHALARRPPRTAAELVAHPHLDIHPAFHHPHHERHTARLLGARPRSVPFGSSQFMVLPLVAARTDCVAVVPQALAQCVAALAPVVAFELPGAPRPIDIGIIWSPLQDADPAHRWFRGVLDRCLREHFVVQARRDKAPPKRGRPARR